MLEGEYGSLSHTKNKVKNYLSMTLNYEQSGKVVIEMK